MMDSWVKRQCVFQHQGPVGQASWRYSVLAAAIGAASDGSIVGLHRCMHSPVLLAELCAGLLSSLLSFAVQRTDVFRQEEAL